MEDNILYKALKEKGLYTKSQEEFEAQFSSDDVRSNLYKSLHEKGYYTKSEGEFLGQFFKPKEPKGVNTKVDGDSGSTLGKEPSLLESKMEDFYSSLSGDKEPVDLKSRLQSRLQKDEPNKSGDEILSEKIKDISTQRKYKKELDENISKLPKEEFEGFKEEATKKLTEEYSEAYKDADGVSIEITDSKINSEAYKLYKEEQDRKLAEATPFETQAKLKLGQGILRTLGGAAGLPSYINKTLFTLAAPDEVIDELNKLDPVKREEVINKFFSSSPDTALSGFLGEEGSELHELFKKQAEEVGKGIIHFDTSIARDLENGDFVKAAGRILGEGAASAPSIGQAMIPYIGIPSIIATETVNKQEELEDEGYDLGLDTTINSIISGTAEGVFEMVTQKLGGKLLKAIKGGDLSAKRTIFEKLGAMGTNMLEEGSSESATALVQITSDALVQGKETDFDKAAQQIIDAGIIGSAIGGGFSLATGSVQEVKKVVEGVKTHKIIKESKFSGLNDVFIPSDKRPNKSKVRIASMSSNNQRLEKLLDKKVKEGEMSLEDSQGIMKEFLDTQEAYNKTRKVKLSSENRVKAVGYIKERVKLEGEIKNLDPALAEGKKKRVEVLNSLIAGLVKDKTDQKIKKNKKEGQTKSNPKGIITEDNSSNYANMTEDGKGNFVFYHVGKDGYNTIEPRSGANKITSREEASAMGKVGGMSMFYTDGTREARVSGDVEYKVTIPKEKVYDFNTDPLNFIEEAEVRHKKDHPNKAFDVNSQLAYVTKVAEENGFEMTVAEWNGTTRAQSTKPQNFTDKKLKKGNEVVKDFESKSKTNKERGFIPVIPKSKKSLLNDFYSKINRLRNKEGKYDSVYHLLEENTKKSQEEITKTIEESDLSEDLKKEYKNILKQKVGKRKSSRIVERTEGKNIEGAPDKTMINVGLNIGKTEDLITEEQVKDALPKDVKVLDKGVKEVTSEVGTELTMSLELSRPLNDSEMKVLLEATQQLAIPQIHKGEGVMYGTTEWGDFNPSFFSMPDGKQMSELIAVENALKELNNPTTLSEETFSEKITNAKVVLSDLARDVNIIVYETTEAFNKANNLPEGEVTNGMWDGKNIHINKETANETTIEHEVMHVILKRTIGSEGRIQEVTSELVKALDKTLPPELKEKLNKFLESYDGVVESEEAIVELTSLLANNYTTLDTNSRSAIKKWLDKIAKFLGIVEFTNADAVEMLNLISGKIARGETVREEDVSIIESGKIIESPAKAIFKKQVGGFDVQYTEANRLNELIKEGKVKQPEDLSSLNEYDSVITSPDDMLAGTISVDGKVIFEGGGGVFFVTKYGDVWASGKKGTANTIVRGLNESLSKNKGRAFLTLAKGTDSKLVSSASGVNSSLAVLNTLLDKSLVSKKDFKQAVVYAVNKNGGDINLSGSSAKMLEQVNSYFSDPRTTTFEKRGFVVKDLINALAKTKSVQSKTKNIVEFLGGDLSKKLGVGETKLSQSLINLVSGVAAEKLTKGLKTGDIYATIEVNKEVELVEDSHPSYPFHIRVKDGGSPILHLPKNRENGGSILETNNGAPYKVTQVSVVRGSFKIPKKAQKNRTLQDSVDMLRNRGYEESVIKAALEKKGYKPDIIDAALKVEPKESYTQFKETMSKSREVAEKGREDNRSSLRKIADYFVDQVVDRQGSTKKIIEDSGLERVTDYMVTNAGASSYAKERSERIHKTTFGDLNTKETELLEEIILLQRVIAIDEHTEKNGLEKVVHFNGYDKTMAQGLLNQMKEEIGDVQFKKLSERANNYFEEYRRILKELREEGIINEAFYQKYKDVDYSPTRYIEKLQELDGIVSYDELGKQSNFGLSSDQIQSLKRIEDAKERAEVEFQYLTEYMGKFELLQRSLLTRSKTIFANRLNKTFAEEFNKTDREMKTLKKKKNLTKAEKKKIKNFEQLSRHVKQDYVVFNEEGVPTGFKETRNRGFKSLYYYKDGVKNRMLVSESFYNKFTDTNNRLGQDLTEKISLATGTALVKTLATGNNPTFFLTNMPRDFFFAVNFSEAYAGSSKLTFVPLQAARLFKDSIKGIKQVVTSGDMYVKALEYGLGMDFLAIQGKYRDKGVLSKIKDKFIPKSVQSFSKNNLTTKSLSYIFKGVDKFNLASEVGIRMAIFERMVNKQMKERGIKDLSKEAKQIQDDIYTKAVRAAREITDFSQGGKSAKAADAAIPYLNAAVQGTRAAVSATVKDPVGVGFRMLQTVIMASSASVYVAAQILSSFRDDEDESIKGMTNNQIYFETLKTVSEYDIRNYFIFPLGEKDDRGNWKFVRIAKAQALTPSLNVFEEIMRKHLAKTDDSVDYKVDILGTALSAGSENLIPKVSAVSPPVVAATIAMKYGIDSYTGNPLDWKRGEIPAELEGIVSDRVDSFYKQLGETFKTSPIRLQKGVESIVTNPNVTPYVGAAYGIMNSTIGAGIDGKARDSFFEGLGKGIKKRLIKSGSEYNSITKIEKEASDEAVEIYRKHIILEDKVKDLTRDYKTGVITGKEFSKEVSKSVEGMDPLDKKNAVKWIKSEVKKSSYKPFVYNIKYLRNKEVRALIVAKYFGTGLLDISTLDERERTVLKELVHSKSLDKETLYYYKQMVGQ